VKGEIGGPSPPYLAMGLQEIFLVVSGHLHSLRVGIRVSELVSFRVKGMGLCPKGGGRWLSPEVVASTDLW
jgi:hypothetical protein